MIADPDLDAFTLASCREGKQAVLDELAPRIGFAVDLLAMRHLLRFWRILTVTDVIVLASQAVDAEHGLACSLVKRPRSRASSQPLEWECALAVRDGVHVTLGARNMTGAPATVPKAWPELTPWAKELARNREGCERWLATEAGPVGGDVRVGIRPVRGRPAVLSIGPCPWLASSCSRSR